MQVLFKHVQGLLQPGTLLLAETGDSIFNCQKLRLPDGCQCKWGNRRSVGSTFSTLLGLVVGMP